MGADRRLVYSSDGSTPLAEFAEKKRTHKAQHAPGIPDDGVVRVGCERRRGGSVTLVHGLAAGELDRVASDLKRRCGTGGTVKDGVVELQGDRRDAAIAYFAALGRRSKRMGG